MDILKRKHFSCTLVIAMIICSTAQTQPGSYTSLLIRGGNSDTLTGPAGLVSPSEKKNGRWKQYIVPASLFGYGFAALKSSALHRIDERVQQEVYGKRPHARFHADDYLEWAPAVTVYGLNVAGVKGAHGFVDRSILYIFSFALAQASTVILKKNTHQLRPDSTDVYAFPSGHTATAFVSAEFMRQEYRQVSPWYGTGGYATAAATGFLRIYNNKHWLSNTLAGAGLGIASTKLVYWVYPLVRKKIAKDKDKKSQTVILPVYEHGAMGVRAVLKLS